MLPPKEDVDDLASWTRLQAMVPATAVGTAERARTALPRAGAAVT